MCAHMPTVLSNVLWSEFQKIHASLYMVAFPTIAHVQFTAPI